MRTAALILAALALGLAGCGGRTPVNPVALTSGPGDKFAPDFSPDGKSVVFVKSLADNETQLFVIGIDGRGERQLTFLPSMNGEPAWSHDGTRVAFQSNRNGGSNIFVVSADMGEKRGCPQAVALTDEDGFTGAPAWSPDDSRLAFESDRAGNFDVYVMNADGDNVQCITQSPTHDTTPAWSPDGRLIAFSSLRAGCRDAWMMDPDGGLPRRLTADGAASWRPRWTPDSKRVVFMRGEEGGEVEFYEVQITGQGERQVVASSADICDPVVSPDGRWLAFSAAPKGVRDIFLLKLAE